MTVLNLNGSLLLHSPLDVDPKAVEELGEPRWVLAPNRFHHLHVGPWLERGLEGFAAPGLSERRPDLDFAQVVDEECEPFGDEVLMIPLRCFPLANEVVVLHRPSRTLIVTDLVFHFTPSTPWLTRSVLWSSGAYPGPRVSIVEKLLTKREIAREELGRLLDLDFDRLIMSHGAPFETGGKDALREAYRWLGM